MYRLTHELYFPPVSTSGTSGIVAFGGDLSSARLLLAYRSGIFPWFNDDEPILWWSPVKRMVLFPDEIKISKSTARLILKSAFQVTFNQNFRDVITNCQNIKRAGENGTWITDEMLEAYCDLHEKGWAKSVEVWQEKELVGGLYGVDLGHIFCGESMFSKVANASKIAFTSLAGKLKSEQYKLLDCQIYNPHLESLGCREIPRTDFVNILTGG